MNQIVACKWNGILFFGQLNLKNHMAILSERELADDKVKSPHTAEPIVLDFSNRIDFLFESVAPCFQGLGVMEAPNFHVCNI